MFKSTIEWQIEPQMTKFMETGPIFISNPDSKPEIAGSRLNATQTREKGFLQKRGEFQKN